MEVANAYGMIQPVGASDTSAVRATFIIDPDGMLEGDGLLSNDQRPVHCGIRAPGGGTSNRRRQQGRNT
jgi:hypothetical protein